MRLDSSTFIPRRSHGFLREEVEQDRDAYVAGRIAQLKQSLDEVDGLTARGELPDAAVNESGLKITPLANTAPEEASVLMRRAYSLLPHITITDLLLEVDRWTGFSRHFTHLKTGEPAKDQILLLTAILADGISLGTSKMAEACPGSTARKLDWLAIGLSLPSYFDSPKPLKLAAVSDARDYPQGRPLLVPAAPRLVSTLCHALLSNYSMNFSLAALGPEAVSISENPSEPRVGPL